MMGMLFSLPCASRDSEDVATISGFILSNANIKTPDMEAIERDIYLCIRIM